MTKYITVPAPPDYPGKTYRCGNRVLQHHLVWWQATGKTVPNGMVLHHINENKHDNRIENLQLMRLSDHTIQHCQVYQQQNLTCANCSVEFQRAGRYVLSERAKQKKAYYCSRACAGAASIKTARTKPPPPEHGEYRSYRRGCRCIACTEANRLHLRAYLDSRKK